MDNFLIIDDVDTAYIAQNSWIVLLEKQVTRNLYFFKNYSITTVASVKPNLKHLFNKIKTSINKDITAKIKNKKLLEKISRKPSPSPSLNLRRKTEETHSPIHLKIFHNSTNKPSKLKNYRYSKGLLEVDKSRLIQKNTSAHSSFLPLAKSSEQDKKQTEERETIRKSLECKFKLPKQLFQAKPILSLHELEFSAKEMVAAEGMIFHKRLAHIETLLIRSSINSPQKCCLKTEGGTVDRKTSDILPVIVPGPNPNKISMSQILSHVRSVDSPSREQILDFGRAFESFRGSDIRKSYKKTQETKESEEENGNCLESIVEECMNERKKQEEAFHESFAKNNRNYRISRVKNIKFPIS